MDLAHIITKDYDARVQPPTSGHKALDIKTKLTIYGVLEVTIVFFALTISIHHGPGGQQQAGGVDRGGTDAGVERYKAGY